ncbi:MULTISPECIES: hypothetical protein [unclassified Halomonas]|uniref:hypothetical protein n=1 Tax=unclassified Halomonas TaxID=2609666 RepID=UPI0004AFC1B8|nr:MULTISPECIES: hypothetical protein [unclassified Halomonas]
MALKDLLASTALAALLAAGPALAEEAAAYRETRLGLYVTASEAYELMQENERAVNGWRNSGLPWSYEVDPDVAWRPAQ